MDRTEEPRWQWRMLVLDLLLVIADRVRGDNCSPGGLERQLFVQRCRGRAAKLRSDIGWPEEE